ncbi:EAL domain-containing protein [Sodalis glossinidius]|uniref:EAL domain-containing protein n=2 Tax=Sodalis glossinidius TaxID=63612 RepID=UPI0014131F9F|nr:EAL domain-containing protein [Sodalis glossinidius]
MLFVSQQNSKTQARHDIHSLVGFIDTVMDNGDKAAQQALMLAGCPCATVLETLSGLARQYPLPLGQFGGSKWPLLFSAAGTRDKRGAGTHARRWKGAALSLHAGPAAAEIVLQQRRGQPRAVVIIDSHTLRTIMNTLSPSRPVILAIGDTLLTPAGTHTPLGAQDPHRHIVTGASARYPYRLQAVMTPGVPWSYFLINDGHMILLVAAIALMMALLIHHMMLGLKRNEFEAYYQPVMNVARGYCSCVEILVCWRRHPVDGIISPDVFVPLAETSGLILPLTAKLMAQVADDLAQHWRADDETLHVAFNIAAIHLQSDYIVKDCRQFLHKVHRRRILLVLELTERQYIEFNAATRHVLASLQALGVIIAIDDFGTGYSGLSYLGNMQINLLKIDRSFVAMIGLEDSATDLVTGRDPFSLSLPATGHLQNQVNYGLH